MRSQEVHQVLVQAEAHDVLGAAVVQPRVQLAGLPLELAAVRRRRGARASRR